MTFKSDQDQSDQVVTHRFFKGNHLQLGTEGGGQMVQAVCWITNLDQSSDFERKLKLKSGTYLKHGKRHVINYTYQSNLADVLGEVER